MLRYPPLVAVDLSPPPAVREGISLLLELIDTYNSMMVPASGKRPNFDPVISALLDPIIQVSFLCQAFLAMLCLYLKGVVANRILCHPIPKFYPSISYRIVLESRPCNVMGRYWK